MGNNVLYILFPEVAGGLGPKSVVNVSVFPPTVTVLNYQIDGWLDDDLLETFPCFMVTDRLRMALEISELTGFLFSSVLVTKSDVFVELYPERNLPNFHWFQINGRLGLDDFSVTENGTLAISSRAKEFLSKFDLSHATIEKYAL